VTAPGGESFTWGPVIFGDVTIADYPMQDASGAELSGAAAPGVYEFAFTNDPQGPGGIAGLEEPVFHAMETVSNRNFPFYASPDPATSWNRPFFIEGVSSLGPTSYSVLEFEVDEPGLYNLLSGRQDGGNHFTFLYSGAFDDQQPLASLLDYGLGNGNSPFNVPQGESRIDVLLFPGVRYFWVCSQWDRFSPLGEFQNLIIGPGEVEVFAGLQCQGDVNGDGATDIFDFNAVTTNFGAGPDATRDEGDLNGDGLVNVFDYNGVVTDFGCEP